MVLPKNIVVWNGVKGVIRNGGYLIWFVRFDVETCENMLSISSYLKIRD